MATADGKIRAFAAVELDGRVRDTIAALIGRLRATSTRVSWTRTENFHLTLRFLGDVEPAQLETYAARVREQIAALPAFDVVVQSVGAFPNARQPSVIWVGVEDAGETLARVHAIAEDVARRIGIPAETRRFVSHITLGRVRRESSGGDISRYLDTEKNFDAGAFAVDAVSLFSSQLTPQGARYTRLHRLTFDGIRGTGTV